MLIDFNRFNSFRSIISINRNVKWLQTECFSINITKERNKMENITVDDLLSHSFVLTINDKRYNDFNKIFSCCGLTPIPQKYIGIHTKRIQGWVACRESHLGIIQMAKLMDWPYVLIFEDDAYPRYGIREKMEEAIKLIPDDCGTFVLGYTMLTMDTPKIEVFNPGAYYIIGSHSYIVFKKDYDKYLSINSDKMQIPSIDRYFDHSTINGTCYILTTPLFIQRNSDPEASLTCKEGKYVYAGVARKRINADEPPKGFPRYEDISTVLTHKIDEEEEIHEEKAKDIVEEKEEPTIEDKTEDIAVGQSTTIGPTKKEEILVVKKWKPKSEKTISGLKGRLDKMKRS